MRCFFFSCSAPTTTMSVGLFLLLFSCCWSSWSVRCHPKGDYFFRFAPCTCAVHGFRSTQLSSLSRVLPTPPVRDFSVNFHHYFTRYALGPLPLFSRCSPDFPDKIEKRTNQRARKRITALDGALSHTHTQHAGRRWQSHNRVCKIFLPFCHSQNVCFRNSV